MITSEPRKFALSLLPHIVALDVPRLQDNQPVQEAFSIGSTLEAVKVVRVETERGLVVEIQDGILGYVHVYSSAHGGHKFYADHYLSDQDSTCI
jgi:rRNA biogenesis protein RRP5